VNKICENIKNLRLERKFTQQDIAEKMYVTRQCISRWEQGITLPDIESIERLSKILNCNVNDIIDNDSLKAIAINEAIKNKKNKKVIFTSIIVSILAIAISIAGFYYLNDKEEDTRITHFIKAIVLEKDSESYELKLKLDERDLKEI
jgi:transcriptional regulator with XRE-family HTH domain